MSPLLVGTPVQDGVADHLDAERVIGATGWCARLLELLGEDHLLEFGEAASPVLRRPRRGQQRVGRQLLTPPIGERLDVIMRQGTNANPSRGEVLVKERADAGAKLVGLSGIRRIHGSESRPRAAQNSRPSGQDSVST